MKQARTILNIDTGFSCNNRCIFCADGNHIKKEEDILEKIKKTNTDKIIFVYGEPTLNKELPTFISKARKEGFQTIALSTNGRMLSYKDYLIKLIKCGLNEITISLHGSTRQVHESITRTPNSYDETIKALYNIKEMKKNNKLDFFVATTLNNLNLADFKNLCYFTSRYSPEVHIINIVEPRGMAKEHYKLLAPRYSECIKVLTEIESGTEHPEISLTDVVPCVAGSVVHTLGPREEQYFESDSVLVQIDHDKEKMKRDECKICIHNQRCNGVWKEYIKLYGWEEFQPIKASDISN